MQVTPRLGQGSYVFPVVGAAGYSDSYGAFRGDVHGKWHHGDDIFAPLGTPVVAVASGTINRVGWHRLGGWRLWVRDAAANQFYYAHLSGYVRSVFHSKHVRAGDVVGFVGNTGDAYTSPPHLHFEVHPHQLLRLKYDGAVDPTTYLQSWQRLRTVRAPIPVHPRLPRQADSRREARAVFRKLLAARHLLDPTPAKIEPATDRVPDLGAALLSRFPRVPEGPAVPQAAVESSTFTLPLFAGLLSVSAFVAAPVVAMVVLALLWRRKFG